MIFSPSNIKPPPGARRRPTRVGRGIAAGQGKTAGRGTKGQRARTGGRKGTARLGFKQSLQKIPKRRGFKSLRPKMETVTLRILERITTAGDVVTPHYLKAKKVISDAAHGVKIVGNGEFTKKITVEGCLASRGALQAIQGAGGRLVV